MILRNQVIPSVWSVPWSHGPQDPNQSKSNKSKKDPIEGITFLIQAVCLVIIFLKVNSTLNVGFELTVLRPRVTCSNS